MKKLSYLFVSFILVGASCRTPKDFQFQQVQNFSIGAAGLKESKLTMDVKLYNPNNYKMKLKKADLDVYLNGSRLGKMNLSKKYLVPCNDTFCLPITVDVDMKNILANAVQLMMNNEATVKLTGKVKAGRHGIYVPVPVNYEGKQDIRGAIKL